MNTTTVIAATISTLVLGAGAVGAALVGSSTATATPSATSSASASASSGPFSSGPFSSGPFPFGPLSHGESSHGPFSGGTFTCERLRDLLPDDLSADLAAAAALPAGGERLAELLELRGEFRDDGNGLTGNRGWRDGERGWRGGERRIPAELRRDLRDADALTTGQAAAYSTIAEDLLAGEYGDRAADRAADLEERAAGCAN